MPIKTSNPASYDKIFEIYKNGSAVLSSGTTTSLPNNRGVLIVAGAQFTFRLYNLEHTTAAPSYADLIIPINTTIILPIQVKYYTVTTGSSCSIYGLV